MVVQLNTSIPMLKLYIYIYIRLGIRRCDGPGRIAHGINTIQFLDSDKISVINIFCYFCLEHGYCCIHFHIAFSPKLGIKNVTFPNFLKFQF